MGNYNGKEKIINFSLVDLTASVAKYHDNWMCGNNMKFSATRRQMKK
jgi:hypothetical protein